MKRFISLFLTACIFAGCFANYTITANATVQGEAENNNSYFSANKIAFGNSITASLSDANDVDYFKVSPTENGRIRFIFEHKYSSSKADWRVTVYKHQGDELVELSSRTVKLNDNETVELPYIGAVAGEYYYVKVELCCAGVEKKNYTIHARLLASDYFEKELNESYGTATVMKTNQTYNGNVSSSKDYDYYKIVAPSNGKLQFKFGHDYKNNSADWKIAVYYLSKGEYHELFNENVKLSDDEVVSFSYIGAKKGGVYFVKVSLCCAGVEGRNYKIINSFTASEYYEKEINDVFSLATVMDFNKSYNGSLFNSADKDCYKVVVSANGIIDFEFRHGYRDSKDDWNVSVFQLINGEYRKLFSESISLDSDGYKRLLTKQVKRGERYFIRVSNCCGDISGISYSVTAKFSINAPTKLSFSNVKTNSVKLTWNGSSSNSGYQVQVKNGNSWKNVKSTANRYLTVSNLKAGKIYTFRARAYRSINGARYYSNWVQISTVTRPAKVTIKAPTTNKYHQVKANWSKVSCSSYQVQFSRYKNFSSATTKTVSSSNSSCVFKNLKKGKSYYVRVRAYKTLNGKKYFGAWSATKSIACK